MKTGPSWPRPASRSGRIHRNRTASWARESNNNGKTHEKGSLDFFLNSFFVFFYCFHFVDKDLEVFLGIFLFEIFLLSVWKENWRIKSQLKVSGFCLIYFEITVEIPLENKLKCRHPHRNKKKTKNLSKSRQFAGYRKSAQIFKLLRTFSLCK